MPRLRALVHEIHRRSLWQVVGIYLGGAWIAYQVVLGLTDGLGLPGWVPPFAFILFLIGLPIVVATAFVQEGSPQRDDFRRAAPAEPPPVTENLSPPREGGSAAAGQPTPGHPPAVSLQQLLTWPRALLGGVLAFAILGFGTTGWIGMRALGIGPVGSLLAAGVLESGEPILIADFQSPSRDSAVAALVSEAFRIDFARSTVIRTVEPATVREILRRMDRPAESNIGPELAHEIALRGGYTAYLTGEVSAAGRGHVISARLVGTESGATLVALRETARDSADLVPAIDRLSRALRERTGESLRTIRRAPPLEQVTTSSLEALRRYTDGLRAHQRQFDRQRALQLYQEAVELDTAFAAAWRVMASLQGNLDRREDALESIGRALRHRDRLGDVDRELAIAADASYRREFPRAIAAYERALRQHPNDASTHNNLAWTLVQIDDRVRAGHHYRLALAADSAYMLARNSYAHTLVELNEPEEAKRQWEAALRINPTVAPMRVNIASIPIAYLDFDGSERALRELLDDPDLPSVSRRGVLEMLRMVVLTRGRYAEAAAIVELMDGGVPEAAAVENLVARFWTQLQVLDRPDLARATLAELRPLVERKVAADASAARGLARACLMLSDVACGRRYLELAGMLAPPEAWSSLEHIELHGDLAYATGDYQGAVRHYRGARQPRCRNCFELQVAHAFLRSGQPDSAIGSLQRFLDSPSIGRAWQFGWQLGAVHGRLAELFEARGDAAAAAQHYSRLVELWDRADPELQPRVERARQGVARLGVATAVR